MRKFEIEPEAAPADDRPSIRVQLRRAADDDDGGVYISLDGVIIAQICDPEGESANAGLLWRANAGPHLEALGFRTTETGEILTDREAVG